MNKLHLLFAFTLILLILVLPVLAQENSPIPDEAVVLPAVLSALVAFNFKTTEVFKRMLASNQFGGVPHRDIQSVLVILFSVIIGIASAYVTPDATSWLPESFKTYPFFAIVLTGFSVSVVGGFVHELLKRLNADTPHRL